MNPNPGIFPPDGEPNTPARLATAASRPMVLPVIEEQAVVGREVVETGRLRISKTVQEHEQAVNVTLQHDEVQVEHVAINQFVADDAPLPGSRQEGDVLIVPVLREVVVTRVLIVKELRISKRVVEETHTSTVNLRQEQIQVERLNVAGPGVSGPATDQP
ncbi:YsnF/AvaK domain-containing protein [Hymenobacter actinosclerus]|uniref:Conserved domain-containing protein n=1 Tax=Hymenobacter actinosclerus TaxID=82805 RepID=A0A1I0GZS7_9BACT|nr:YsnF/AvaK domain-containing protein [Hymenobacter actinosclerus]SET76954.1 conserved domain-containing protein [Hymenobacter actinosclerus]